MVVHVADGRIAVIKALGEFVFRSQSIIDVENNRIGQLSDQTTEIFDRKR